MLTEKKIKTLHALAAMLMVRNAQAGMSGKPCPVAVRVAQRIEATLAADAARVLEIEGWIAEGV